MDAVICSRFKDVKFNQQSSLVVTCAMGLTEFLSEELKALGFQVTGFSKNHVITAGNLMDCLRLNMSLRTAYRVNYELISAPCFSQQELKTLLMKFRWEEVTDAGGHLFFKSFSNHPTIRNSMFLNQLAKDAVVDYFKTKSGKRPDAGKLNDRSVSLFVHWSDNFLKVYLDTTGISLDKRGYRLEGLYAPMQETLAAALIMASGWDGSSTLYNPMCGSGTLAVEAALQAANIFPGLIQRNYALMNVRGFEKSFYEQMLEGLASERKGKVSIKIVASDQSTRAVKAACENAQRAGVARLIDFSVGDFENVSIEPGSGMVILNPPYGQRLGEEEELIPLYKSIGSFFKKKCSGKTCFVFTGNRNLAHQIGLKASRKLIFFNGDIECRLLRYDMYEGSRKKTN